MPTFGSYDGTPLSYRAVGSGEPLVVVPGGPARDVAYLGDLGGLDRVVDRQLILLEMRGTGRSDVPVDTGTYRANRLVLDVESLLDHLGLGRADLFAHSAGANVALLLAEAKPERLARLLLIAPSARAVGITATDEETEAVVEGRSGEPWYEAALEAGNRDDLSADDSLVQEAFSYGRWDDVARAHAAADAEQRNLQATDAFHTDAYAPGRTAASMADVSAPVRILVGGFDCFNTEGLGNRVAALFKDSTVTVQRGAGHFPWLDDAQAFTGHVKRMLSD
jgi:pimeloyl-ACP methyl ester carboxylesterase